MAIDPGFLSSLIHPLPPVQAHRNVGLRGMEMQQRERLAQMQEEGRNRRQQAAMRQDDVNRYTKMFLDEQQRQAEARQKAVEEYQKALVSANPDRIRAAAQALESMPGVQITDQDPNRPQVSEDPSVVTRSPSAPSVTRKPTEEPEKGVGDPDAALKMSEGEGAELDAIRKGLKEPPRGEQTPEEALRMSEGEGTEIDQIRRILEGPAGPKPQQPKEPAQEAGGQAAEPTREPADKPRTSAIWEREHYIIMPDGQVVRNDPNEAARTRQQLTAAMLAPLQQNASTPEQKAAAKLAAEAGARAASTLPYGTAVELGYQTYWKALGEANKTHRALESARIQASRGMGGREMQRDRAVRQAQQDAIEKTSKIHDVPAIVAEVNAARAAYEKISNAENPMMQRDAMREYLARTESRPSDKDYERIDTLNGTIEQLRNKVRQVFAEGRLTEKFRHNFAQLQKLVEKRSIERRAVAAEEARARFQQDWYAQRYLTPEQRKVEGDKVYRQVAGLPPSSREAGRTQGGWAGREGESASVTVEAKGSKEQVEDARQEALDIADQVLSQ